jgi:hypothetical protein
MLMERQQAIIEELRDVQSLRELEIIEEMGEEYSLEEFASHFAAARERLEKEPEVRRPTEDELKIAELEAQIRDLKRAAGLLDEPAAVKIQPQRPAVVRPTKRYRLLSTDVSWTSTPQAIALMAIIGEHVGVGEVVSYEDLVRVCVANEKLLNTRQGGKKILDYYKGDHERGFIAHGNLEEVK